MDLKVGDILEGKVKSITKFGAFVLLPGNRTGMVHISEVSGTYVKEIRDHLTEGQTVRVKILGMDEAGKISLSIKRAQEPQRPAQPVPRTQGVSRTEPAPKTPTTFEEKLKRFMQESDSKLAGCRQYEHKTRTRRR